MNLCISQELVGFRVRVQMINTTRVEGLVHRVDAKGSKLSLKDAVGNSNTKMADLYHVYVKDINQITKLGRGTDIIESPNSSESPNAKKLIRPQSRPLHLSKLQHRVDSDVMVNKVPHQLPNLIDPIPLPPHTIIESINDAYHQAVDRILKERVIGIGMEGVRLCRSGVTCWIGVAIQSHVYLFDMCSLGKAALQNGLQDVYLDSRIVKVVHDCRYMADTLIHQYGIHMVNVFDTQVAASAVELQTTGTFSRYVTSLNSCLTRFLELPREGLFYPRIRDGHEEEDESRWKQRPLPDHLVEGAVLNVCYLIQLRDVFVDRLLSVVQRGTDLYLNDISRLDEEEVPARLVNMHLLPVDFKSLLPRPANGAEHDGFSSKVAPSCDPYLNFTRHITQINPKRPADYKY